ncbi:hypothetical protein LSTR_LSTR013151 [Laodelphax striatellus]|uniref:PHD-type domain-containing protein n=1 Tax=Laodelphax striatellus TaxID=195883 RepID=A0A482XBA0_LAOST|nr:hypothetical protein LSTR_LSTR013151 [Laodelphax striatellus]
MSCVKCHKTTRNSVSISCSLCNAEFHSTCVNLKAEEVNFFRESSETKWKCEVCTVATPTSDCLSPSDLQRIAATVKDLLTTEIAKLIQTELAPIRNELSELKVSVNFLSNEFDTFKKDLTSHKSEIETLKREIAEGIGQRQKGWKNWETGKNGEKDNEKEERKEIDEEGRNVRIGWRRRVKGRSV